MTRPGADRRQYPCGVTVTLRDDDLEAVLEDAYLLASGAAELPATWVARAEQLGKSPSVAFIAAVGAVLLAKPRSTGE